MSERPDYGPLAHRLRPSRPEGGAPEQGGERQAVADPTGTDLLEHPIPGQPFDALGLVGVRRLADVGRRSPW